MTQQTVTRRVGILHVFKSVLASFFGVQSSNNRERDFKHGKPGQYIVVGLILTIAFILTVVAVVRLVMYLAGV
jgi:uncharacterized membrane protein YidH (DUF202 family)